LRTIDNGKTEMTGYNQESTKDENGNKTFTGGQSFSFNDIDVDRSDLTKKNNPMTLSFVSSNRIDNIIDKSGIKDQSVTSRYSYAANESNASNISGTGKMDYKMNFLGNNLYIINGIGYNMADAGNYVWGYAMGTMGFTSLMARSAAHLNAWWSAKQSNGEGSQNPNSIYRWIENRSWGGDAAADQRAIQNGLNDSGSYFTSKVRSIKRFFSF